MKQTEIQWSQCDKHITRIAIFLWLHEKDMVAKTSPSHTVRDSNKDILKLIIIYLRRPLLKRIKNVQVDIHHLLTLALLD